MSKLIFMLIIISVTTIVWATEVRDDGFLANTELQQKEMKEVSTCLPDYEAKK